MRLTAFTDYTLRTLIYLAQHEDRLVTIQEIAELHSISKSHLTKVVHQLGMSNKVETIRGRHGGLKLNLPPEKINIGEIVRNTETDFDMAECFDSSNNTCSYSGSCNLKGVLSNATASYLSVLDAVTLADLVAKKNTSKVQVYPRKKKQQD
ncbi:RrF2 family transcriptional regulator [Undibacterium pigrum]|uniref:BadM/Rrf2 family transcriptional regulator n=1 Tax=Undibacterium pigrum TaxID=401470 RepID=A0A318IXU7_9BURK|nr:Rrf2 family transcriptional regulator [Undibacterium pigrum]PXX40024.1 BadM/Rrf2 family transcriptional regulator [Undibacterium pigrum]